MKKDKEEVTIFEGELPSIIISQRSISPTGQELNTTHIEVKATTIKEAYEYSKKLRGDLK